MPFGTLEVRTFYGTRAGRRDAGVNGNLEVHFHSTLLYIAHSLQSAIVRNNQNGQFIIRKCREPHYRQGYCRQYHWTVVRPIFRVVWTSIPSWELALLMYGLERFQALTPDSAATVSGSSLVYNGSIFFNGEGSRIRACVSFCGQLATVDRRWSSQARWDLSRSLTCGMKLSPGGGVECL